MAEGYSYCFSNPSMPGILKVGMTERTPEARLNEANASDTWRPPTPYKIEFAKKVSNASQKEKTLHILLEQYTDRIHPRREFFRISPEEVRKFFDLMDGEMWSETRNEEEKEEEEKEKEEEEETSSETVQLDKKPIVEEFFNKDFELFFETCIRKDPEAPEITFRKVYRTYCSWYTNLITRSRTKVKEYDFKEYLEKKLNVSIGAYANTCVPGIDVFASKEEADEFDNRQID